LRHPIAFHVVTFILAAMVCLAAASAVNDARNAHTLLQALDVAGQVAYGVFALAAVLLRLAKRPGARTMLWAWAVAATWTGAMAPVAWGGAGLRPGIAAFLGSAAVAGLVLLMDRWARGAAGAMTGSGR
jgi:hypothetical protein